MSRSLTLLRRVLFWLHLCAGVTAGAVILLMCITGVLLTYERQLIAWSDSGMTSTVTSGRARLGPGTLIARFQDARPDLHVAAITIASDASAPAAVATNDGTVFVDAYTGQLLGPASSGIRQLMTATRSWHRWLSVEGERRGMARLVTGYANLMFLFIIASGPWLWLPRIWTWRHIRPTLFFERGGRGRARDFNWHNTIGIWSAIPLFVVVLCALPISFPWANASLYRMMGDEPPASSRRGAAEATSARADAGIIDAAWLRAEQQEPDWKTITVRLPAMAAAPLAFTVDKGNGGQPQLRSTLTLDRRGAVVRYETFGDQPAAARLRAMTRFTHTGEILGFSGQTIAGLVSLAGAMLVWTGISLAIRRLRAYTRRRGCVKASAEANAA